MRHIQKISEKLGKIVYPLGKYLESFKVFESRTNKG